MNERMTIWIPSEYRKALRAERYEKNTTFREIVFDMLSARYGAPEKTKTRRRKKEGSNAGA